MRDPRIDKLAKLLVMHSCALRSGEKVLIEAIGIPTAMIVALIREAKQAGATPLVNIKNDRVIRELCLRYEDREIQFMAECELHTLRQVDAFIGLRGFVNISELSDVPGDRLKRIWEHYVRPVHLQERNENTKWVFTRWPTPSAAQHARMSTEEFEDFYFNACMIDYARMDAAMAPLLALMGRTDEVRIVGPGDTDLTFSIQGIPAQKYAGHHNVPDGELMTAPRKHSVNGRIHYNVPTVFYGTTFENIRFNFLDGRIVKARCNDTDKLNAILDQDEGARYVGEFAFGCNPAIAKPTMEFLFDEKMRGTLHVTPGNAYRECDNGNRSSIHWDLVLDQTPEMGGGEVYFDGVLVRQDGRFVPPELQCLNPESMVVN